MEIERLIQRRFEFCASYETAGYNFEVFFNLTGPLNSNDGMILELSRCKPALQNLVDTNIDHCHLPIKTCEELAKDLFFKASQLEFENGVTVVSCLLHQTPGTYVYVDKNGTRSNDVHTNTNFVKIHLDIHALHKQLKPGLTEQENKALYGKCARLHGHTFVFDVFFEPSHRSAEQLNVSVNDVIGRWNHQVISDDPAFAQIPATCEHMMDVVWDRLFKLEDSLSKVSLKETFNNGFIWRKKGLNFFI